MCTNGMILQSIVGLWYEDAMMNLSRGGPPEADRDDSGRAYRECVG